MCGGYPLAVSNALHSSVLTFYIVFFFSISLTNCCAVLCSHFLCLIPVYRVIKFVDFFLTFSVNFSRILLILGNVKFESFLKVFELLKYIHLLFHVFYHNLILCNREKFLTTLNAVFLLLFCFALGKGTTTGIWLNLPQEMTGRRLRRTA